MSAPAPGPPLAAPGFPPLEGPPLSAPALAATRMDADLEARPGVSRGNAWLMPCLLSATLFQNLWVLSEVMSGEALSLSTYDGPLWQKLTKDCIYVFIAVGILTRARMLRSSPFTVHSAVMACVIAALGLMSAISHSFLIGIAGLRWVLPFLLFLLMKNWVRRLDVKSTTSWFILGLAACLAAQIYQLMYMPPVFGEVLPGIPARVPGIFIAPNSAAFFACASAACVLTLHGGAPRMSILSLLMAAAICALTQSGAGILTIALLIVHLALRRHPTLFWAAAVVTIVLIFPNLDQITLRDDFLLLSGGSRLERFIEITQEAGLSFNSLGLYTNATNLLSEAGSTVAVDSLLASWIGNFGLMAAPLVLFTALFVRRSMGDISMSRATPCVIVFAAFSVTTIVFEAFPMNIHLAIGLWLARKDVGPALETPSPSAVAAR
jgi:hypothetical protein